MAVGSKDRPPCRRASNISSQVHKAERRISVTTEINLVYPNSIRMSQHKPISNQVEKRREQKKSLIDLKVAQYRLTKA
jgi:hypothetical protein